MSSTAPAPATLSGAIQSFNKENSASVFQRPNAPRINLKELIHNEDTIVIDHGDDQWVPQHLLFFNDISPRVDHRLALREEPRAVAQPFFACVPANPGSPDYLWGSVRMPVLGEDDSPSIDFEQVFDPATEPPMVQMVIHTDAGSFITVDAEQGSPHITVLDVQRKIIQWMREMRTRSGINDLTGQFSRWVRMVDDDGAEVEVEIFVRGLNVSGRALLELWSFNSLYISCSSRPGNR